MGQPRHCCDVPRRPDTVETVRLNEKYLTKRNKILDLKYKREAMELARGRDELIERALSYLALWATTSPAVIWGGFGSNEARFFRT
jgi:hypothetical protein